MDALLWMQLDRMMEDNMHPRTVEILDELYSCWPVKDVPHRLGVLRTNMTPVVFPTYEEGYGAVFQLEARINHSCEPNAESSWDVYVGRWFLCHIQLTFATGERSRASWLPRET